MLRTKRRSKSFSLKRRVSEHSLLKESRKSFLNTVPRKKRSTGPSINPVRKSIKNAKDDNTEIIVHYNRRLHSQKTIDSRHENYYEKFGLPQKPSYDPKGRRFNDESSETDPDYDHFEFMKLTIALNAKRSIDVGQATMDDFDSGQPTASSTSLTFVDDFLTPGSDSEPIIPLRRFRKSKIHPLAKFNSGRRSKELNYIGRFFKWLK